jgi:hypothetical protein
VQHSCPTGSGESRLAQPRRLRASPGVLSGIRGAIRGFTVLIKGFKARKKMIAWSASRKGKVQLKYLRLLAGSLRPSHTRPFSVTTVHTMPLSHFIEGWPFSTLPSHIGTTQGSLWKSMNLTWASRLSKLKILTFTRPSTFASRVPR